jgi:hypothetical protein
VSIPATEQTTTTVQNPRPFGPKLVKWAVSLFLVGHFSAIIIAAASVSPSSDLAQSAWKLFQPYLEALYLNHGYRYFAPEPSQSTLLAFVAERADGSIVRGRIPDRAIQPRLLYHRHFMLTERMPTEPPELVERWYASYAQHLGHRYGAKQVSLTRVTHFLPTLEMVREGVRLDDPRSYEEQPIKVFQCDER